MQKKEEAMAITEKSLILEPMIGTTFGKAFCACIERGYTPKRKLQTTNFRPEKIPDGTPWRFFRPKIIFLQIEFYSCRTYRCVQNQKLHPKTSQIVPMAEDLQRKKENLVREIRNRQFSEVFLKFSQQFSYNLLIFSQRNSHIISVMIQLASQPI